MDGVEGRPNALSFFQAVPPGGGEGTEILAAQFLLAPGHFGDHGVALRFGRLVAVGGQLRARREEMAREVAAQFAGALAVLRLLPSAERFRRSNRQSGIGAERKQQTVLRQPLHIAAIPLLRVVVHATGQQADLRHGKGFRPGRNILARELQRSFEGRGLRRERPAEIPRSRWRLVLLRGERLPRRARSQPAAYRRYDGLGRASIPASETSKSENLLPHSLSRFRRLQVIAYKPIAAKTESGFPPKSSNCDLSYLC